MIKLVLLFLNTSQDHTTSSHLNAVQRVTVVL